MSANGRCPLLMSAVGRFFHMEFMVVHSRLQLFGLLFGGVRYSGCPLIGGLTIVKKNAKLLTQSLWKQNKTKNLFIVYHEDLLNRFVTFFISIKHVFVTVMASIEYIYIYIEYITSKSNSQNCQVENNMKIIFAMEKYVTPPRIDHKHQH